MSKVFLSHANEDSNAARSLRAWLHARGCRSVFLCSHPRDGIPAGEKWQNALRSAGRRAKAVLLLVSPAWLASKECWKEFKTAELLNKKIIPVIIDGSIRDDLPPELSALQVCDTSNQAVEDEGYESLRLSLQDLGVFRRASKRQKVALGIAASVSVLAAWFVIAGPPSREDLEAAWRYVFSSEPALQACDDSNYSKVMTANSIDQMFNCLITYVCSDNNTKYRADAESRYCFTSAIYQSAEQFRILDAVSGREGGIPGLRIRSDQVTKILSPSTEECDAAEEPWVTNRHCDVVLADLSPE